jgi:phospholipase C
MGFTFNRSGIRVPAIAISPWIAERTVVNNEYRHTSVIRTLRERWSLGAPLTGRDAIARDIAPILSRDEPRDPADWPAVVPLPVPKFDVALVPPDAPLTPLPRAIFLACLELGKALGQSVPDIAGDAEIKGGAALAMIRDMFFNVFPGLRSP